MPVKEKVPIMEEVNNGIGKGNVGMANLSKWLFFEII
jgi:hypothetical protein